MFSPQILSLDQRIQKAISFLPPAYRLPPEVNGKEAFGSLYAPIPDIFLILVLNLFKWPKVLMHLSSQCTNRHTPISDSLQQTCTHIEIMQNEL